jgi:hypothetical protein
LKKTAIAADREVTGLSVLVHHLASGKQFLLSRIFYPLRSTPYVLAMTPHSTTPIPWGNPNMSKFDLITAVATKIELAKEAVGRAVKVALDTIA